MRRIRITTPSPRLFADVAGPLATVVLHAPERRNCLDLAAWAAFPALFDQLEADHTIRVVVLKGAGDDAFCAGADIAEFETERATPEGSRAYEIANVAAFDAVAAIGKPVIAAIQGFCFGAGVGLAASADIRIAADDAMFAIPASLLGVGYPPGAFARLVALLGPEAVKRLFFAAQRLDATQALGVGLVGEVVATSDLDAATQALAHKIADGAPLTITAAKRAIDAAAGGRHVLSPQALQALADACFQSADYAEGRAAFKEKRKPMFSGM